MRTRNSIWIIAGHFLLSGFFPASDGSQWVRMPELVAHYRMHNAEAPLSFAEFLLLHYADPAHASSDERHKHLPLQQGCAACQLASPLFSHSPETWLSPVPQRFRMVLPLRDDRPVPGAHIEVFHPPRA